MLMWTERFVYYHELILSNQFGYTTDSTRFRWRGENVTKIFWNTSKKCYVNIFVCTSIESLLALKNNRFNIRLHKTLAYPKRGTRDPKLLVESETQMAQDPTGGTRDQRLGTHLRGGTQDPEQSYQSNQNSHFFINLLIPSLSQIRN